MKDMLEEIEGYKSKTISLIEAMDGLNRTLLTVLEKFPETFGRMSFVNRRRARSVNKVWCITEWLHWLPKVLFTDKICRV